MRLGKSEAQYLRLQRCRFCSSLCFLLVIAWAVVAGIGLLVYALSDAQMWRRLWERTRGGPAKGPRPANSKVSTTVDPEQSEIHWLGGGTNLFFSYLFPQKTSLI